MAAPFVYTDVISKQTDYINGIAESIADALGDESIPTIEASSSDPGASKPYKVKKWEYSVSGTANDITLQFSAETKNIYDYLILANERWKLKDLTINFKNLSSAFASGIESLELKGLDTQSDISQPSLSI